jgi:hypothetical protein
MIYRIEFPPQDPKYRGGMVTRWHKSPGDVLGFGDDLFDIEIDRVIGLRHTKRAALIARSTRKLNRLRNESEERTPRGRVRVRVTTAEPMAHIRHILVEEGDGVLVGGTVALASSTIDEPCPVDVDISSTTPMRVVLNIADDPE